MRMLCLHHVFSDADGDGNVSFQEFLHASMAGAGIAVRPPSRPVPSEHNVAADPPPPSSSFLSRRDDRHWDRGPLSHNPHKREILGTSGLFGGLGISNRARYRARYRAWVSATEPDIGQQSQISGNRARYRACVSDTSSAVRRMLRDWALAIVDALVTSRKSKKEGKKRSEQEVK